MSHYSINKSFIFIHNLYQGLDFYDLIVICADLYIMFIINILYKNHMFSMTNMTQMAQEKNIFKIN